MVGPRERVWKVLRDTDGERFVALKKIAVFKENLQTAKIEFAGTRSIRRFKNFLYVISYPLATELFAFGKNESIATKKMDLPNLSDGPPQIDFGVAKTFAITIMRLPRWKR